MKKKLLVLSASAVLASHFLVGGEASAIVSGEKNPYTSKALSITEKSSTSSYTSEQYKHTKISCEEIYDDRFLHSYFL
ncbi:hypothetical protein [Staphylococcus pseudintermedius]|uniref:hypothetical protein n=1 Tax=Staphylococcus pseudintermedius TaxID=283734 RepID=UPI0020324831|nr:hypothetical protein [Staphylococcus pseudintermedius]